MSSTAIGGMPGTVDLEGSAAGLVTSSGADSFWDIDGYRRTVRRIEDGLQQCGELMKFIQERADIEKEYAKRLKGWAKKWNENFDKGTEYGTNKLTLKGALDEAERLADIHLDIKERLLNEVQAQIKDWKNENYKKHMVVGGCKEAKNFEEEFRKAQKPWAKRYEKLVKSKKDYHLACKLERTANNQENNARNSTEFSPDQVKKMQEKVEKCRREVESSRERYQQSLNELNSYNAKYVEDMSEVYQRTQEFERHRLEFCKKVLYNIHACLDLTQCKQLPEIYSRFRDTINQSDSSKDLKWWSQVHGVEMPMSWPTFEEYSPEFTEIGRKKCADVADTGNVTLKRITTNRYNEEFGPGEYSPELQNNSRGDKSRGGATPAAVVVVTRPTEPYAPAMTTGGPGPGPANAVLPPYTPSAPYNPYGNVSNGQDAMDDWTSSSNMYMNYAETQSAAAISGSRSGPGEVLVRALFEYQGQEEDELSFQAGDVFVKIKDRDDQGWCTGRREGRVGLYPDSYVERVT